MATDPALQASLQAELTQLFAYKTRLLNELNTAPIGPDYSVNGQAEQVAAYHKQLCDRLECTNLRILEIENDLGSVPATTNQWRPQWRRTWWRSPYVKSSYRDH
jgi:hypothetical protein